MVKVLEIQEMADYIQGLTEPIFRAANIAMMEVTVNAVADAKRNVMKNFGGDPARPKTGALANSIFSGFEKPRRGALGESFVGVRSHKGRAGTQPYGRIQEYGGIIRPFKAQNLWIPLFGPKSKGIPRSMINMTPREFFDEDGWIHWQGDEGTALLRLPTMTVAMFALRKWVEIPDRPYVTPAVEKHFPTLPAVIQKHIASQMRGKL